MKNKGLMLLMLLALSACKKYDDGPGLSFRSHTERLSNTWIVDKMLKNGEEKTSEAPASFKQTFDKNGNYSFSYIKDSKEVAGSGKWQFQNNDMEVRLNGISNMNSVTYFILRLKENSLWYYYMDGNDKFEYHLVSE